MDEEVEECNIERDLAQNEQSEGIPSWSPQTAFLYITQAINLNELAILSRQN